MVSLCDAVFLYLNPRIGWGDYSVCSGLFFKLKAIIVIAQNMIYELPDRPWFSLAILLFNNLFNGRTEMFDINNEKNKSAVILSPEAGVKISGASVESVVNDRAKTKPHHALRRSLRALAYGSTLKMTTSASCREARKRRFLFNLIRRSLEKIFFKKIFSDDFVGFMPLAVALILTFGIIRESRAECNATENNLIKSCYEWNPGVADNCGKGCTYTYDSVNHKLTVTATKPDAVVPRGMFSSDYYESGKFPNFTDIEIDGEFKKIGTHAFLNNHNATIHGKDWVLLVNETDHASFNGSNVGGTVIVDDGQTKLGEGPWSKLWTGFNGTLILPPSITSIDNWFLHNLALGADAKVYCGAENCEELFRNFDCEGFGKKWGEASATLCKNHLNKLLDGKLLAYPDGCAKMWSTGCIKCKNENFKLNDGECDRLRWTPAEAAKVLRDDNTNSVTITFKK